MRDKLDREIALLSAKISREQSRLRALTPAEPACCPDCWQYAYHREAVEAQDRRRKWLAILERKAKVRRRSEMPS